MVIWIYEYCEFWIMRVRLWILGWPSVLGASPLPKSWINKYCGVMKSLLANDILWSRLRNIRVPLRSSTQNIFYIYLSYWNVVSSICMFAIWRINVCNCPVIASIMRRWSAGWFWSPRAPSLLFPDMVSITDKRNRTSQNSLPHVFHSSKITLRVALVFLTQLIRLLSSIKLTTRAFYHSNPL